MRFFLLAFLLVACAIPRSAEAQTHTGTIRGTVTEQSTEQPLPGANVRLEGTQRGAATDSTGAFVIRDVPVGTYALRFRFVGYETYVQTDVVVRAGRATVVNASLRGAVVQEEGVTVTADYFQQSDTELTSVTTFSTEELRRAPGAGGEISRVLNALPGVASRGDTSQDLFVRGGAPLENAFYVDNIFFPSIQHFRTAAGTSNGPTGVLNTQFIESVDFSTGGFSAAFGNRLSAVGELTYRDGATDMYTGEVGANFTGGTVVAEGPIGDNGSSFFVSGRRSYLDVLAGAINAGGAPSFGDAQGKATLKLNGSHKVEVLNVYGQSRFAQDRTDARDEGDPRYVDAGYRQNTTGANWRALWGEGAVSNTSVSYSRLHEDIEQREVEDTRIDVQRDLGTDILALRNRTYVQLTDRLRADVGAEVTHRAIDLDYTGDEYIDQTGTPQPGFSRDLTLDDTRLSAFASAIVRPVPRLQVTAGARLNHTRLNGATTISPRVAVAYDLTDRLTLSGAGGLYRQDVPLYLRAQDPSNQNLGAMRTTHAILGAEYRIASATRLTVEVFDKRYRDMPELADDNPITNPAFVLDAEGRYVGALSGTGEAYARGVEVLLQKKLKSGVYGLVSGSYFRSRYEDINGTWRNRDYDTRTLISAIGGYKPNDRWDLSVRWTYLGGRPTPPVNKDASAAAGETVFDASRYNEDRLPPVHSLYLRADRRFTFGGTTLVTFLSIWNAYSRANVEERFWNVTEGRVDAREQFSLLPVGGVQWEF